MLFLIGDIMVAFVRAVLTFIHVFTSFVLGFIFSLLRPFNPSNLYYISRFLTFEMFNMLGIEFEKRGVDIAGIKTPAVYMSNHQNNLDLLAGGSLICKKTVLVGKKSLKYIPFFGQFFILSGSFLIDRANPRAAKESMIRLTKKILNEKVSVWILPEGTRSNGRGLLPFKKGGFITAINAQVPIVPVVYSSYTNTIQFSKKHSGKIIAKVMEPIQTKGLTLDNLDELMKKTHHLFEKTITELDQEIAGEA
jgi:1-acyl-sn-glycerol-3-phosphate acyltransferase